MEEYDVGAAELGRAIASWLTKYDAPQVFQRVAEGFEIAKGNSKALVNPEKLSLGGLAYGMLGDRWAQRLHDHTTGVSRNIGYHSSAMRVREATEGVDASAFTNITGQLLVRLMQKGYNSPVFIGDSLVEKVPEPMTEAILGELKVPDITGSLQGPSKVQQGMPYPAVQVKEDWITLPAIEKFGFKLPITLEALAQDRTGRLQAAATRLGLRMGIDREERILRPILGMVNPFKWLDTAYTTYLTSGNWINKTTGVTVANKTWELLNTQIQLFVQMTDPYTGKVIEIDWSRMKVLCMPESIGSFFQIMNASSVNTSGATTAAHTAMIGGGNPYNGKFELLTSPYARALLTTADADISWSAVSSANVANYWYFGDFQAAFIYREWLKQEAFTAPPLHEDEFNKDVIFNVKIREAGRCGVMNPRYSSQSIGS